MAMGIIGRKPNCEQPSCSSSTPCKQFRNSVNIGIGNRYIRTAAANIMEVYRKGKVTASRVARFEPPDAEEDDSEVQTVAATANTQSLSREDTVELY